jgi:hypothetical protein
VGLDFTASGAGSIPSTFRSSLTDGFSRLATVAVSGALELSSSLSVAAEATLDSYAKISRDLFVTDGATNLVQSLSRIFFLFRNWISLHPLCTRSLRGCVAQWLFCLRLLIGAF